MQALDHRHRVTVAPFQKTGVPAAAGLTTAECEAAAWAIAPGRHRYRGAAAINAVLAVAVGTSFPLRLYGLPGIRQLQDWLYAWVAKHRHRLPGDTPYCEQHPNECG